MDFQITIHSISARSPKHTAPWFVKVRTDGCYLYKTRALTGVDLEFREKFDFAEWDKSIKLEVWKSESSGAEFSLIAVVPLDFPNAGSYSTSFDLFSEMVTGKYKSSNSSFIISARSGGNPGWRDPIAQVKVTVVHLSGFKARASARLKTLEDDSRAKGRAVDETKSAATQSMKTKMPDVSPARQPAAASMKVNAPSPAKPSLPTKPKWVTVVTDEGDEYYLNTKTDETTWDKPDDFDGPSR